MPLSEEQRLQKLEDKMAFLEQVLAVLRAKLIKARLDVLESHENGERPMSDELPSDEQLRVIADDVHDPTHLIATELLALRAENTRLRELNGKLTDDFNTLLVGREKSAEATRAKNARLRAENARLRATDG